MIKVGITGQSGFIGTHLYNYLGLKDNIERVEFEDNFFKNHSFLEEFVRKCDVIIHLAALNRHKSQQVIYNTNIDLVKKLISACEGTNSTPHIIFSSSTQEEKENLYGRSKLEGRKLFEAWARKNGAKFTGFIIPNVFGPFGVPHYNSVVATFCFQLTHGASPKIHVDGELNLIYINELLEEFYKAITGRIPNKDYAASIRVNTYRVPFTSQKKVSEILSLLETFKKNYFESGIIPDLSESFNLALFNTFRCYIPYNKYPFFYQKHADVRGVFVEIARTNTAGQFSFSTTKPGITRGNHFHLKKVERFSVIKGKAKVQLRRIGTDKIVDYYLDGTHPAFVDIPVWHTHNITNIGQDELITLFWSNEFYDSNDSDTYFEKV